MSNEDHTGPRDVSHEVELDRVIVTAKGERLTVRELRERVYVHEPGIIVMREIDRGHAETLETLGQRIEELAEGLDAYGVVIDLQDATQAPTSSYGRYIPKYFAGMNERSFGRLKQIGVAFLGNPVVRVAAIFVVGRIKDAPFSVHKSFAEAVRAVREKLP